MSTQTRISTAKRHIKVTIYPVLVNCPKNEPKLVPVPDPNAKLPLDKKHAPAPELTPKKLKKPRILTPAQKDCKIEREACKQDCKAEKKECGKMRECAAKFTSCKQDCNQKFPCH